MIKKSYALGHAFSARDLFTNFNVDKLKMTPELCKAIYSDGSKRDFSTSIFLYSIRLVLNDIIDNGVLFKLPGIGRTLSYLEMHRTEGEEFKKAFKNGKWRDIDFITSNFSGYLLLFRIAGTKRAERIKPAYVDPNLKNKITEYTNLGKLY